MGNSCARELKVALDLFRLSYFRPPALRGSSRHWKYFKKFKKIRVKKSVGFVMSRVAPRLSRFEFFEFYLNFERFFFSVLSLRR